MKIVGLMVCGAEADRYLETTLKEFKRLCDDAVIATNQADQKTKDLIREYGFWQYEDNREWGRHQPEIKTDLLKRIAKLRPDWILPLDADETLPTVDRLTLEELAKDKHSCYFYVVNLYNDESHYAKGLAFWNIRFFKFLPEKGMQYLRKPLHCGLAPPYFYSYGTYVPHIMLHTGLMKKEDRLKKAKRYQTYDPNAKYKDRSYYDALVAEGTGTEYSLEAVNRHLKEYCTNLKQKKYD